MRDYDDWSHSLEGGRLRKAADQRRAEGDMTPWHCPECHAPRRSSHTLRVHMEIAHGIPSGLES